MSLLKYNQRLQLSFSETRAEVKLQATLREDLRQAVHGAEGNLVCTGSGFPLGWREKGTKQRLNLLRPAGIETWTPDWEMATMLAVAAIEGKREWKLSPTSTTLDRGKHPKANKHIKTKPSWQGKRDPTHV